MEKELTIWNSCLNISINFLWEILTLVEDTAFPRAYWCTGPPLLSFSVSHPSSLLHCLWSWKYIVRHPYHRSFQSLISDLNYNPFLVTTVWAYHQCSLIGYFSILSTASVPNATPTTFCLDNLIQSHGFKYYHYILRIAKLIFPWAW